MTAIIRVENLSKKYIISHQKQERYTALRDVIMSKLGETATKIFHHKTAKKQLTDTREEFFALKDINFEIKQGDRVGIIGRNGAGKSTLLKILSRITEPTTGRITLRGRVSSLLEVGTGFHPELTGRENIFLNGAILGMTKKEIKRKFDEIVDFAEIEKFLDTPVKRYSSGMYLRLAFAVAAHLEPEILIVDEVLAVGDAQFQKKCLGKIEEVGKEGRTVLFVSHNMAAIVRLCEIGIYLNQGDIYKIGNTSETIKCYLQDVADDSTVKISDRKDRQGSGIAKFSSIEILDSEDRKTNSIMCGQNVKIRIILSSISNRLLIKHPVLSIGIDDSSGIRIWHLSNETTGQSLSEISPERDMIDIEVPKFPLVSGKYIMTLFLSSNNTIIDWVKNAASINVVSGDFYGTGKLPPNGQGYFLSDYSVKVSQKC